jgi:dTDP-4-amino-4,6-dideoxygalactose transaminase
MTNPIPFVDLRAQHEEVRGEIEAAIKDIIDRSSFIGGSYVAKFEQAFASYIGVKEAVGVANGTDALWLGLVAAGIGPGDAVITVPNTFIATVEAITRSGAAPCGH